MNIKNLTEADQKQIEIILDKELHELLPVEITHLHARRDYLNREQLDKYSPLFSEKKLYGFDIVKTEETTPESNNVVKRGRPAKK